MHILKYYIKPEIHLVEIDRQVGVMMSSIEHTPTIPGGGEGMIGSGSNNRISNERVFKNQIAPDNINGKSTPF